MSIQNKDETDMVTFSPGFHEQEAVDIVRLWIKLPAFLIVVNLKRKKWTGESYKKNNWDRPKLPKNNHDWINNKLILNTKYFEIIMSSVSCVVSEIFCIFMWRILLLYCFDWLYKLTPYLHIYHFKPIKILS